MKCVYYVNYGPEHGVYVSRFAVSDGDLHDTLAGLVGDICAHRPGSYQLHDGESVRPDTMPTDDAVRAATRIRDVVARYFAGHAIVTPLSPQR